MVPPVHFSVSLFKEWHPEVSMHAGGEDWLSFGVARDQLVHRYFLPSPVFAQSQPVDALAIQFPSYEKSLDQVWILS